MTINAYATANSITAKQVIDYILTYQTNRTHLAGTDYISADDELILDEFVTLAAS